MTISSSFPVIRMLPNKSPQRVRFGAPWVYADEVVLDRRARKHAPGTIVELQANDGERLGLCAFNPVSKIICRMLDRDLSAVIDRDWLVAKLTYAQDMRARLYDAPYYRLIHAEADGLPGVVIDRFGDVAVIQPNAAWAEVLIDDLAAALIEVTGVTTVVKNGTGRARSLEGLAEETVVLAGEVSDAVPVQMNGATYFADLTQGQKPVCFWINATIRPLRRGWQKAALCLTCFHMSAALPLQLWRRVRFRQTRLMDQHQRLIWRCAARRRRGLPGSSPQSKAMRLK